MLTVVAEFIQRLPHLSITTVEVITVGHIVNNIVEQIRKRETLAMLNNIQILVFYLLK